MLVDAVRSGAAPGTSTASTVADRPLPAGLRSSTSTHAVGIGEAIELARALGRLPRRLVVYGVEGRRFDAGAALSPDVAAAVDSRRGRGARRGAATRGSRAPSRVMPAGSGG